MLLTYVIGCIALIAKPGPDLMCTLATAISDGRKSALSLMGGMIFGCWLWILLLAAGFAPFFLRHPQITKSIQAIGVCYIGYLAYCSFKEAAADFKSAQSGFLKPAKAKGLRLVWRGIAMAMSNPLTILFFLAFLPNFTLSDSGKSASLQTLALGTLFCALIPFISVPMIMLASFFRDRLFSSSRAVASLKLASAIILVAVAGILLASLFARC